MSGINSTPTGTRKVQLIHRTFPKKEEVVPTEEEKLILEGVKANFDKWDLNGDGNITRDEVVKVLEESKLDTSKESVDSFINMLDTNNNGQIEWDEFKVAYLRKYSRRQSVHPDDLVTNMEEELRHRKHN